MKIKTTLERSGKRYYRYTGTGNVNTHVREKDDSFENCFLKALEQKKLIALVDNERIGIFKEKR